MRTKFVRRMRALSRFNTISFTLLMTLVVEMPAVDYWWHGGVSSDPNIPANWTDRSAITAPSTPAGFPPGGGFDTVRIGASWGSEDLNQNGVLNIGEDLNGNGVIDDPVPPNIVGFGGWYGSYIPVGETNLVNGGGMDLPRDVVLTNTYVARTGDAYGGWWLIVNAPNRLTLENGAFLIMSRDNCSLRNGGSLVVRGRNATNGPSLIVANDFRIAEEGSVTNAVNETSRLIINGTGWMQMDPLLHRIDDRAVRIGVAAVPPTVSVADYPYPKGEILIEGNGTLEVLPSSPGNLPPWIHFGTTNPSINRIVLRDQGRLLMPGELGSMGQVGTNSTTETVSLNFMINTGLIMTDQPGASLVVDSLQRPVRTVISVEGPIPPFLSVVRTQTGLELTYEGTLQESDHPSGPFTNVVGAVSPFSTSANQSKKYYRAKSP